jgi:hypothetical protein
VADLVGLAGTDMLGLLPTRKLLALSMVLSGSALQGLMHNERQQSHGRQFAQTVCYRQLKSVHDR